MIQYYLPLPVGVTTVRYDKKFQAHALQFFCEMMIQIPDYWILVLRHFPVHDIHAHHTN